MLLRLLAIATGGIVATLLALELLFRALPVATATMSGYYIDPDLLTYPAHHRWAVATGWDLRNPQILQSNALGFAAEREFVPDPAALVLIGDSYVEAPMLSPQSRPAVQLGAMVHGQRAVYGMGGPGSSLLDYAQRIRFASENLAARDFVVWLEAGDARQALCGSGDVHSRCLDRQTLQPRSERVPPPSAVKRWFRHSALAQYVFGQLKLNPAQFRRAIADALLPGPVPTQVSQARSADASLAMVDAVVAQFFAEATPHLKGRLLFVVDGRREPRTGEATSLDLERQRMLQRLAERGAEVMDLEPLFAEHRARSPLSLEVGPYDRHLNAMGVKLVMVAVAARLAP